MKANTYWDNFHRKSIALAIVRIVAGIRGLVWTLVTAMVMSLGWVGTVAAASPFELTDWPGPAVNPSFALTDSLGHPHTLNDYQGKVVVIFFGYTRCPGPCPSELLTLALAIKSLPRSTPVQVLFISLDPEHDSANKLLSYTRHFHSSFIGLTGTSQQLDQAAGEFGVTYARVPAGSDYVISHDTNTYLLDKTGRLRLVATLESKPRQIAHDIALLAREN